ncbi:MAG: hypothetical protein JW839_06990, partial [Candidatus Lokiarchaeota archaeon]|nr:hypothetical protein [Candidatus Lokiarchaeota archaeon]
MEIDKASSYRKQTEWKIKLDKDVVLVLNAIEDSSLPEPSVSVVLSEGDRKVSFTTTKEKFLNLNGVLDSFSQVCLGVEPVLAQEDYAVKEPKVPEKKAEKAEPPVNKAEEPEPAPAAPPAPAAAAKQPEPPKATSAEDRMMAKLEGSKPSPPPMVAFPPRFPRPKAEEDEESDAEAAEEDKESAAEAAEEDKAREETLKDISELEAGPPGPAPDRAPLSPPAKPA